MESALIQMECGAIGMDGVLIHANRDAIQMNHDALRMIVR
jgi:hypothetical protein